MLVGVLTQIHVLQKEKYWWIEMFEMNGIMVKKHKVNNKLNNHFLGINKFVIQFFYLHLFYFQCIFVRWNFFGVMNL
jgi:hypothetical protein